MATRTVIVHGLDDLNRGFRKASAGLELTSRAVSLRIAQSTLREAVSRAETLGGVHRHVIPGMRAGATGRRAYIILDPNQQPAVLGAEFGGGARVTTRQFPPWRGTGDQAGYMVYPSIYSRQVDLEGTVDEGVAVALRKARLI